MWQWRIAPLVIFLALISTAACTPTTPDPELRQEIQSLRTELQTLKEKLGELSSEHQKIQEMLSTLIAAKPTSAASEQPHPDSSAILTVTQVIREHPRLVGRRLTVRGEIGLVLLHRKSFYLKSPDGMVEVLFGDLRDKAAVDRLTSQNLTGPITITGQLLPPSPQDPKRLQIIADLVDF